MGLGGVTRAVAYARNSSAKQRSIAAQAADNRAVVERAGWQLAAELSDGSSASRYATKVRANWTALLGMLSDVDVVVLWEASRGDRTLASWVAFLDQCRERGVLIHATGHGSTYDPRKPRDYRNLAEDGVDAAYESDKTSLRLLRGFAAAAANGRPHAHTAYGYERVYHPRTGEFTGQREHPEHAAVVREIVRRIGQGDAVAGVARDLTRRGVPSPAGGAMWVGQIVRRVGKGEPVGEVAANLLKRGVLTPANGTVKGAQTIVTYVVESAAGVDAERQRWYVIAAELVDKGLLNPVTPWNITSVHTICRSRTYLGIRTHRSKTGEVHEYPGDWPALVTEAEHHAAVRVLSAPDRVQYRGVRPGRASSLLGNIAYCGTCGERLAPRANGRYRCCVNIGRDELEQFVTEAVIAGLSSPKLFRQLRHGSDADDKALLAARAEVDRLTDELGRWRQSAVDGQTTPESLAVIEAGITTKIRQAQARAEQATVSPVVRELVSPGADIRARWDAASLAARREIVRTLMAVTVHSFHGRSRKITDRVELAWRTG
jgi:DNA invertase Pin-like site-specific DNA recombinase